MLKPNVKLSSQLWARVRACSERAGYSSAQEFVEHVLDRECRRIEGSDSKDEILKKLKGLGYVE